MRFAKSVGMANKDINEPSWWNQETHGSAWDRVKEAMKRDWEQTKHDFGGKAPDLKQEAHDTVDQMTGHERIPVGDAPLPKGRDFATAEPALRFGYAAAMHYGHEHPFWSDKLETKLRSDWDAAKQKTRRAWNDVKGDVRRAFEMRASQRTQQDRDPRVPSRESNPSFISNNGF